MQKWDVTVIGGGLSGLSVGALLANNGRKVLVLEKEQEIGGRMISTTYKGHIIDNGVHAFAKSGYVEEVFSRLGRPLPEFFDWKKTEIYHRGEWMNTRDVYPRPKFREIMTNDILKASDHDIEKLYDVSLSDWVAAKTDDEDLRLYFWFLGWLICVGSDFETISAGDLIRYIRNEVQRAGSMAHFVTSLRGGFMKLAEPLAEVIKEKGGEIWTNTRVSGVVIENREARGVEVERGERIITSQLLDTEFIESSIVINTLPIWDIFKVISQDDLPRWYVDWVKGIKDRFSNVWTLMVSLDKPIWDELVARWWPPVGKLRWPGCAEFMPTYGQATGQHQLHLWFQTHWYQVPSLLNTQEVQARREIEKIFTVFEKGVIDLFPELDDHCLWKIRHAAIYGMAESPGTMGIHRPGIKPPIKKLYFSSDTLQEARSVATQNVARAALKCVDSILEEG